MTAKAVSSAGILVAILGTWLVFRFGLPAREVHYLSWESSDPSRPHRWGRLGLLLLMVGQVLQLVGTVAA